LRPPSIDCRYYPGGPSGGPAAFVRRRTPPPSPTPATATPTATAHHGKLPPAVAGRERRYVFVFTEMKVRPPGQPSSSCRPPSISVSRNLASPSWLARHGTPMQCAVP